MSIKILFTAFFSVCSLSKSSALQDFESKKDPLTEKITRETHSLSSDQEIIQKVLSSETVDPGEGLKLKRQLIEGVKDKYSFDYNLAFLKLQRYVRDVFTNDEYFSIRRWCGSQIENTTLKQLKNDPKIAILSLLSPFYCGDQRFKICLNHAKKQFPGIRLIVCPYLKSSKYMKIVDKLAASKKSLLALAKKGNYDVEFLKNNPFGFSIADCFRKNLSGADIEFLKIGVNMNNSHCVSLAMEYYINKGEVKEALLLLKKIEPYDGEWYHLMQSLLYTNFPSYFKKDEFEADVIAKKFIDVALSLSQLNRTLIANIIINYHLQGRFFNSRGQTPTDTYAYVSSTYKEELKNFEFLNLQSKSFFQMVSHLYLSKYHESRDRDIYWKGDTEPDNGGFDEGHYPFYIE